jgi:DNA-binding response OmpR family regulator
MKKRVLVVEDDRALARVLSDTLAFSGFEVSSVADGNAVLPEIRRFAPDIVLLDLVLPAISGLKLCSLIRQGGRTPVIMLTALSQTKQKIQGLSAGADDYITKPFDYDELLARIQAILRRARPAVERVRLGDVIVDFRHHRAIGSGGPISLTRREFDILLYLAERQGFPVFRRDLLREIWGFAEEPTTRAVDFAIRRLRLKIEPDPHKPRYIQTVHGDGYSLCPDE